MSDDLEHFCSVPGGCDTCRPMIEAERARRAERWPTDADEEATRELVALADSLSDKVNRDPMPLTGIALVNLYLDVEAILIRHDRNPRKLLDAMHYLSRVGND